MHDSGAVVTQVRDRHLRRKNWETARQGRGTPQHGAMGFKVQNPQTRLGKLSHRGSKWL